MRKQEALDELVRQGFDWAIQWDADETWAVPFWEPLRGFLSSQKADSVDVRWVNLWGEKTHARTDDHFGRGGNCYTRTKLYRIGENVKWVFKSSVVYGPSPQVNGNWIEHTTSYCPGLHCVHWGYRTPELREEHRVRWNRVYGHHWDGKNPYGLWDYLTDPTVLITTEPHRLNL
jgi:hypothetical protein